MYAVMKKDEIIGFHEDLEVVKKFTTSFNPDSVEIVKIKKKKEKKIRKNPYYDDLYLVRYGDKYLPINLYMTAKEISFQEEYDLKYCKDIISRIITTVKFKKMKDFDALYRSITIITDLIDNPGELDYETLKQIKSMRDEYKIKLGE